MIVGCVAFPFGWNSNDFRKICGPESNRFELGLCGIRWAYPLAIIGNYESILLLICHQFMAPLYITCMQLNFGFMANQMKYFRFSGCIDACILATLAFILATRHVRLQPEPMYQNSIFKSGKLTALLITYINDF